MILVTGEAGLGKSTFINSLFLTDVYNSSGIFNSPEKTTSVREHQVRSNKRKISINMSHILSHKANNCIYRSIKAVRQWWSIIVSFLQYLCLGWISHGHGQALKTQIFFSTCLK